MRRAGGMGTKRKSCDVARKGKYMSKLIMGYLVEYYEKTSMFFINEPGDNFSQRKKALCSRKVLSEMLLNSKYVIMIATMANVEEYKSNHPEEKIELLGF